MTKSYSVYNRLVSVYTVPIFKLYILLEIKKWFKFILKTETHVDHMFWNYSNTYLTAIVNKLQKLL